MEISAGLARGVTAQVKQVILGKDEKIDEIMLAFLAGGHILLEDIPGVGKTTMALAFSRAMRLDCHRVQFTPDVMPSDLTGFSIYNREKGEFIYQPGSVFCNLLLADELNRTSPKTQSALLEVMEEGRVTVEGVTRQVSRPFLVMATQNPYGNAGTQRLPEAQVDRFMITMTMGYPDFESELAMAMSLREEERIKAVQPVIDGAALMAMQHAVHGVYIKEEVYRYLLQLVCATRSSSLLARGASPRATIALVKLSRAAAWFAGRTYVTPADVRGQFSYVAAHRVSISASAKMENRKREAILAEIADGVKEPAMGVSGT